MKKSVFLTIALLVLMIPAVLSAQSMCASMEKEACKATCKEKMELNEEQKAKIAELKFEQEISSIKLEAELKVLKITLKQEMSKDDPSEKELKALVSKIASVQEKQHMMKIEHMLAMRKILGPEMWKMHKKCCGGMGYGCFMDARGAGCCADRGGMGMCGCGCCGGGHGCTGMGCSGCGGKHVWIEKGGCCGTGDTGGAYIIKMDDSGMCGGGKTVDIHKMMESCHPGEMKIKACIEGDEGKKGERCIKIEKVEKKE